jgi:hypothetical protein
MIWKVRDFVRMAAMIGLSVSLVVLTGDAWAQRRGGGAHARPNVTRQGPARSGSFNSNRNRPDTRRDERPAPDRSPREDRMDRRDPGPDRIDTQRVNKAERGRGPDEDDRRKGRQDRPVEPARVQERRENRRDYYDDRRDDRRQFARGVRYSSVWWTSNSCRQTVIVVQDGYSYYQCNGAWFGRTYYGGEVTYTVIDAPQGY